MMLWDVDLLGDDACNYHPTVRRVALVQLP